MKKNVLMIGRGSKLCKEIMRYNQNYSIYIIEEPDILKKMKSIQVDNIVEIRTARYHQSNDYLKVVQEWAKFIKFDLVIPAFEYSVYPANEAAKLLSLPRIGDIGAQIFTNKIRFREFCRANNIPHPRFGKIETKSDLEHFFKGKPIIFKPANRHASLGVVKINNINEISKAFDFTTSADENLLVPERQLKWEYIAEDMIYGDEYSVEIFVNNGEIQFFNITEKQKFNNGYFVESGHKVPANLDKNIKLAIQKHMKNIVKSAQIETSVLHAEWIIQNNREWIIECAGRIPGDRIPDLISHAYGFNFKEYYLEMLSGKTMTINRSPLRHAAIRYFEAPEGILEKVNGIEILDNPDSNVILWEIGKSPGDFISQVKCSWDRIGFFITYGDCEEILNQRINSVLNNISFDVR
ncbi:ATP-grasp domain-containing protein [Paramaledivibacter caminithermalis]|jgi:biotin carboxylase|uniref:Biotin carboxylase n=1 Tax=Paramaledivibacter caminithermalis (strain DSM 15212 / CIP 107654 / DViRD3) TaxID=1121301 RepID=A0A1M6T4N8_PARC5|nr:ATP-grasp domain-containing protein [Paramaledivibacter caminithermalis]SHK51869.1 Biotin carboxylase [Paramaledivibacter caminithermalis DSM 15212]